MGLFNPLPASWLSHALQPPPPMPFLRSPDPVLCLPVPTPTSWYYSFLEPLILDTRPFFLLLFIMSCVVLIVRHNSDPNFFEVLDHFPSDLHGGGARSPIEGDNFVPNKQSSGSSSTDDIKDDQWGHRYLHTSLYTPDQTRKVHTLAGLGQKQSETSPHLPQPTVDPVSLAPNDHNLPSPSISQQDESHDSSASISSEPASPDEPASPETLSDLSKDAGIMIRDFIDETLPSDTASRVKEGGLNLARWVALLVLFISVVSIVTIVLAEATVFSRVAISFVFAILAAKFLVVIGHDIFLL